MSQAGLLGVGSGILKPEWLALQNSAGITQEEPINPDKDNIEARDDRIVKTSVTQLIAQTSQLEAVVNIPIVAAGGSASLTVLTDFGKVNIGDYVTFVGASAWPVQLVPVGCPPATVGDSFVLLVTNPSAAASAAVSPTLYFLVHKQLGT